MLMMIGFKLLSVMCVFVCMFSFVVLVLFVFGVVSVGGVLLVLVIVRVCCVMDG